MKCLAATACLIALLTLTAQTARAAEQDPPQCRPQWWLATFSTEGHKGVRKMLHTRQTYRDVRANLRNPEIPGKEFVAVEPVRSSAPPLVLVMYQGIFICGSEGCPLEVLQQDRFGKWRELLDLITYAECVAFGPESSKGYKDIVLIAPLHTDNRCPVWRFIGNQYNLHHFQEEEEEPCRSLVERWRHADP